MPRLLLPLPEIQMSVTRPVVLDIVRQVIKNTHLPKDIFIFYPGDHERGMQPGSAIRQTPDTTPGDPNLTEYRNRLSVNVEESYNLEHVQNTLVWYPEELFIFRDDRVDVGLRPVYCRSDMEITFSYRAQDEPSARRWRDDMRTRVSLLRDVFIHKATYHYLIPAEYIVILQEIHRLRENVAGYGQTFQEWLKECGTNKLTYVTNLSGTEGAWAVAQTQDRIQGMFDFSDNIPPKATRDGNSEVYTAEFTYKFSYYRPSEMAMNYPMIVHNQVLSEKYRNNKPIAEIVDQLDQYAKSFPNSAFLLRKMEATQRHYNTLPGVAIPSYDDFIPALVLPDSIRVLTALITLNTEPGTDPSFLMSLRELGDMRFNPVILGFLISEGEKIIRGHESVFALSLYDGVNLEPQDSIRIDADLSIYSIEILDIRKYHHIRLSLYRNWAVIDPDAIDRLRQQPEVIKLIVPVLDPTVKVPTPGPNGAISKYDMQQLIIQLNRRLSYLGNGQVYNFYTVQTLFISSYRS